MTDSPCWPTRSAEGSLKLASPAPPVVVPVEAGAGDGVAGALLVVFVAGAGAGGGAGVEAAAGAGVDGAFEEAWPDDVEAGAFGCGIDLESSATMNANAAAYLRDHTDYETLLLNAI